LLDAEAFRCPGDMAFLGDRDEIAEVAQLHRETYPKHIRKCLSIYWTLGEVCNYIGRVDETPGRTGAADGERREAADRGVPEMGRRPAAQRRRGAASLEQHLSLELRLGRRDQRRPRCARPGWPASLNRGRPHAIGSGAEFLANRRSRAPAPGCRL